MEGNLRKFVQKVRFFQKSLYPKRYFVIDFTIAKMFIKKDRALEAGPNDTPTSDVKVLPFRSILDCSKPCVTSIPSDVPKKWRHLFMLRTIDRVFTLFAQSENEVDIWMAGFIYVITSTRTV